MKFALSQKIGVALIGILLLAVASSGVALVWAWRTEQAFRQMLTHSLEQAQAVYELEIALLEQSLSTSLYLMGGDLERLTELRQSRPQFEVWLARAKALGFPSLEDSHRESEVASSLRFSQETGGLGAMSTALRSTTARLTDFGGPRPAIFGQERGSRGPS